MLTAAKSATNIGTGNYPKTTSRTAGTRATTGSRATPRNEVDDRAAIIVMGTYQGSRFLREQLDSLAAQTHCNWRLYVSDDGSTDETREIIRQFSATSSNDVILVDGPRQGYAVNFLTAICRAPEADYYAFSDQDDIWEPDKLKRALSILQSVPENRPALYCGRTRIVDAAGRPIGLSPAFCHPPSFANALVQSIGGGNTMVMNSAARKLLATVGVDSDVVSHDWWAYQLVSGTGGYVYYDLEPKLRYRQHDSNQVGANNTLGARAKRIRQLFQGRFKNWTDRNIRSLGRARHVLTPESQAIIDALVEVRSHPFPRNVIILSQSGIYRQTLMGSLGLNVAAAFGKL